MASKWRRQVERNAKKVNLQRKRNGQPPISQSTSKDDKQKGRSWMLSLFLFVIGIFYMVTFWDVDRNTLYWVTVIMYLLLALTVFFLRRPFLGIDKSSLTTRKFAGLRIKKAEEISKIEIQPGMVIIEFNDSSKKWVFSRFVNRYNINEMAIELQEFAARNKVNIVNLV
ncbi:MAG: methyltransferase [Paenibacillaceae bacterium]